MADTLGAEQSTPEQDGQQPPGQPVPEDRDTPSGPNGPLHPLSHVILAAVVGTPVGAAWLMARNARALGRPQASGPLWVLGVVLSGVLFAVVRPQVEANPLSAVAGGAAAAALAIAIAAVLQGAALRAALMRGAQRAHPLFALAAGAASLALTLGAGHVVWNVVNPVKGGRVGMGPNQWVYFEDQAQQADGQRLGEFLKRTPFPGDPRPFFGNDHAADVKVIRHGPHHEWVVKFVLTPGAWDRQPVVDGYGAFGAIMRRDVYGGQPLEIQLVDDRWNAHRRIPVP